MGSSPEWIVQGNATSGFAQNLYLAELIGALQFDTHAPFAVVFELLDHAPAAAHRVAEMRDALEARVEASQLALRRPAGQQPAQPRHAEHALREHVRHAGAARDVGVDVNLVVIAGCTGEQRQRRAVHGRQLQRRQFVTDANGIEEG